MDVPIAESLAHSLQCLTEQLHRPCQIATGLQQLPKIADGGQRQLVPIANGVIKVRYQVRNASLSSTLSSASSTCFITYRYQVVINTFHIIKYITNLITYQCTLIQPVRLTPRRRQTTFTLSRVVMSDFITRYEGVIKLRASLS